MTMVRNACIIDRVYLLIEPTNANRMRTTSKYCIVKSHELEFTHSNSIPHAGTKVEFSANRKTKDKAINLPDLGKYYI